MSDYVQMTGLGCWDLTGASLGARWWHFLCLLKCTDDIHFCHITLPTNNVCFKFYCNRIFYQVQRLACGINIWVQSKNWKYIHLFLHFFSCFFTTQALYVKVNMFLLFVLFISEITVWASKVFLRSAIITFWQENVTVYFAKIESKVTGHDCMMSQFFLLI